jgi:hypothetical protein
MAGYGRGKIEEALIEVQDIKKKIENLEEVIKFMLQEYTPSIKAIAAYEFLPKK